MRLRKVSYEKYLFTNNVHFSRPTTPQTAPTMATRRKQTSTTEQSPEPSPTVSKATRRTVAGQQQQATTTASPTTPKRGRKPTKLITPTEQSPEKQSAPTDRPVRIALSSHLVRLNFSLIRFFFTSLISSRISIQII
jgi:hypothetical protein